jgi:hypothetical protein
MLNTNNGVRRGGNRRPPQAHTLFLPLVICLLTLFTAEAVAECILVRERQSTPYTPHLSVHFGAPEDVPAHIQCSTAIEKRSGYWCIPIYAWNLWDDVRHIEFAVHTPIEPTGFDKGPQISGVQITFDSDAAGTMTSFELTSQDPLCGPALLGCLRLSAADLPASFTVQLEAHQVTQRRAVRTVNGSWRSFSISGDAQIGSPESCNVDACGINRAVADLTLRDGNASGVVDLSWTSGSGSFTLIRYRTDGQYPTDPWDGELLAFLPSSITELETQINVSGDIHVTAWSVTRGLQGRLLESSSIECGSVSSLTVHQPIAIEETRWHEVKNLYR